MVEQGPGDRKSDGYAVVKVQDTFLHGYCRTIILICQGIFENWVG